MTSRGTHIAPHTFGPWAIVTGLTRVGFLEGPHGKRHEWKGTAGDHKGPPNPAPLCSVSSTATTLSRLVLRTQQYCKDYPRPYRLADTFSKNPTLESRDWGLLRDWQGIRSATGGQRVTTLDPPDSLFLLVGTVTDVRKICLYL